MSSALMTVTAEGASETFCVNFDAEKTCRFRSWSRDRLVRSGSAALPAARSGAPVASKPQSPSSRTSRASDLAGRPGSAGEWQGNSMESPGDNFTAPARAGLGRRSDSRALTQPSPLRQQRGQVPQCPATQGCRAQLDAPINARRDQYLMMNPLLLWLYS